MNILKRIRNKLYESYAKWHGNNYDFRPWKNRTFFGIDNSTIATNETIFSVITRLSNSVASLPIKLYQNYDIKQNTASETLLNVPNPNMTNFEFIRTLESSRNETGNGYALIERDVRGNPVKLTPIDSNAVSPAIDKNSKELWYEVLGDDGKRYYIHNVDMIHVKHIAKTGGIEGISPIKVLSNANDFDKAVREFSLKEMQSAPNSFILQYDANVDGEKRQRVIDDFKRFYKDNGGILFQEPGVSISPIDRKYVSADTLASEKITRSRVANVYNMPIIMLNDTEGQSYASNEQLMISFVQLTLMPIIRQYEQEFNRKLLTPSDRQGGFYFKFNEKALLRADVATQGDYYAKAIRNGWMTQDEVRQSEDLTPMKGNASTLWVSGDLYPIETPVTDRKGTTGGGGES